MIQTRLEIHFPIINLANNRVHATSDYYNSESEKQVILLGVGLSHLWPPCSPLVRPPSHGRDPYEPWDMTARERELSTKYLHLMTYHVHR